MLRKKQGTLLFTHQYNYGHPLLPADNYTQKEKGSKTGNTKGKPLSSNSNVHKLTKAGFRQRDSVLEERIRRIVKEKLRLDEIRHNDSLPGISVIADRNQLMKKRILWGIMLIICSTLCIYQLTDRVRYFLDVPVSVDVLRNETIAGEKLSLVLCAQDSDALVKLQRKYRSGLAGAACFNHISSMLEQCQTTNKCQKRKWNIDAIWNATVMSNWSISLLSSCNMRNAGMPCKQVKSGALINISDIFTYYGICKATTIEFVKNYSSVAVEYAVGSSAGIYGCPTSMMTVMYQDYGALFDIRRSYVLGVKSLVQTSVFIKSYHFLSRRSSPCLEDTDIYHRCQMECRLRKFKSTANCRLPFIPEKVKLPLCNVTADIIDVYNKFIVAQRVADIDQDCKCPKPCDLIVSAFRPSYFGEDKYNTFLTLQVTRNSFTYFVEKPAYDVVNLLADFGGTLGLCLGLSLLSFIDIAHWLLNIIVISTRPKFSKSDFIYVQINKLFETLKAKSKLNILGQSRSMVKWLLKTEQPLFVRVTWLFVLTGCSAASFLFISHRIAHFFTYPTRNVLKVVRSEFVGFPVIIDCGESEKIREERLKLSNKTGTSCCDVDLLDFIDEIPATQLWEDSINPKNFIDTDWLKVGIGADGIIPIGNKSVNMPEGKCTQFHVGSHRFVGIGTSFTTVTSGRKMQDGKPLPTECDMKKCLKDYRSFYLLSDDEELIDVKKLDIYFEGVKVGVFISKTELSYWNSPKNPCVSTEEFLKCRSKCVQAKLLATIKCSLPFVPPMNLQECKTTKDAVRTREAYMSVASGLDPIKDCNCLRRCKKTLYTADVYQEPFQLSDSILIYSFLSNVVETVAEEPTYSLTAFLCDIGGNLGLTLGFSLLCIPEIISKFL